MFGRVRILCVDDHEENRILVAETLADDGIEVEAVGSGDEALASFAARPADLVLLDVRMPGRDGFATLDALRVLPGGADVPVVFLTALREIDTFDRALARGAADFLVKPIRPSELSVRVRTLVELRRLGAEVRAHHDEIRRQRDALMRAQLQRERLTSFVVHDLKNPLAGIRMSATLLLRMPELSEEARECGETIAQLSDRLGTLVLNLLDLARADEGQLEPRRAKVDLATLTRDVVEALSSAARARELSLASEVEGDPSAVGDVDLLRRVMENLVDNALRHAPPRSTVRIEARRGADGVELRVRDEGAGIPEALRDKIFDRFVQLEKGASRSGRGLGLSFCKTAVEAQGGSIHVDSAGAGAVFVVRLPAGAP